MRKTLVTLCVWWAGAAGAVPVTEAAHARMIQRAATETQPMAKLAAIQRFYNSGGMHTDSEADPNDYWKTPVELRRSGVGDCEDYAIAKYFDALAAGIPESQLRLAIGKLDGLSHVIVLYTANPLVPLALELATDMVAPPLPRFVPLLLFTRTSWWLPDGTPVVVNNNISRRWADLLRRLKGTP